MKHLLNVTGEGYLFLSEIVSTLQSRNLAGLDLGADACLAIRFRRRRCSQTRLAFDLVSLWGRNHALPFSVLS